MTSVSGPDVSMFSNVRDTNPRNVPLSFVLNSIRSGEFKMRIEKLRRLSGKDFDNAKRNLPAFTVSGTCSDRKTPLVHSNLIQIDLDGLENSLQPTIAKIKKDRHVRFGFISPSGHGLKLGLAIDGDNHESCFEAARDYFSDKYQVAIDTKVRDRLRLCFVSYDPQLWENHESIELPPLQSRTESTEVIGRGLCGVSYSVKGESYSVKSIEEAVSISLPAAPRRNNASLFTLARALIAFSQFGKPISPLDRLKAFDLWYSSNTFLRNSRDHYFLEFMNAINTAKTPLGQNPIQSAWQHAKQESLPPEAEHFESREARDLIALCFQLEKSCDSNAWFLSCRDAAKLVGLSHASCANWLKAFVTLGFLRIVEPGTKQRAVRYRWAFNKAIS